MTLQQIKEKLQAEIIIQEYGEPNDYAKCTVLGLRYAIDLLNEEIEELEARYNKANAKEHYYSKKSDLLNFAFWAARKTEIKKLIGEE